MVVVTGIVVENMGTLEAQIIVSKYEWITTTFSYFTTPYFIFVPVVVSVV